MLIYKLDQQEDETRSVVSHRSHKAEIKPKLKLTEFTPSTKPVEVSVRIYIIRVSLVNLNAILVQICWKWIIDLLRIHTTLQT